MKLTAFLTALSFSAIIAAAPVSNNSPRGFLPTAADILDKMYPHNGVPRLAQKLDKILNVCQYT
ncbi:hypothetical protein N7495_002611 [Penicillium taxi]|uniref:uncharacterized protein n=1 Tax=Penicillium taxi TaxID=168475 RepID=UPI002544E73A|nr:uncharacterized protein N7495_002611 [Penicillium taxi]KAJ5902083.1 hypothetical protein N7495_002611 [Penicillium taxi]